MEQLLAIDKNEWKDELEDHKKFLAGFDEALPKELLKENETLLKRLG
jgi:GTP-dependent phosphoenolpyruvate carboxykinase